MVRNDVASADFPEGLGDRHADRPGTTRRHASLLSLAVLGGLIGAALLDLFGGGKSPPVRVVTPAAALTVTTPQTMRSGLFFETRIVVTARRPVGDAVIALPPSLWRDQTINTAIPAAEQEESANGAYRFHYGPLAAGRTIELKFDGQINPPLFAGTRGSIALLDGERTLAAIPLRYRVWP